MFELVALKKIVPQVYRPKTVHPGYSEVWPSFPLGDLHIVTSQNEEGGVPQIIHLKTKEKEKKIIFQMKDN